MRQGYDCVIVGAGSAGGVLAAQLSENARRSVLLLEAGPDYGSDPRRLPAGLADAYKSVENHDWNYVSEPGLIGRSVALARGKVVGGSSAVNSVFTAQSTRGGELEFIVAIGCSTFGCGLGFATIDLAEIVGRSGQVMSRRRILYGTG